MRLFKIRHLKTGLVWNRFGSAAITPAKGDALTLYADTGSKDQRFEMHYIGDYVYFLLESNPKLAVNRHSLTGKLMLWPLADSKESDILFDTATIDGKTRLVMPHYGAFVTAPDPTARSKNLSMERGMQYYGSQFFELVEAGAGGGNSNPGGGAGVIKLLGVPCSDQMQWSATHCFAAVVLDIANYFGFGITMDTLAAKGCIRKSDGYVYTSWPYFAQTITGIGAGEAAYCKTITEQIGLGAPVVVKISGAAGDHFVCAVRGGANADEVLVNDPMIGRVTLRKAFARKGQAYQHLRVVKKL